MSSERIRKTRSRNLSCAECRRRKIRCLWDSTSHQDEELRRGSTACKSCTLHNRTCLPQVGTAMPTPTLAGQRDPRAGQIDRLERQIEALAASFQRKPATPGPSLSPEEDDDVDDDNDISNVSFGPCQAAAPSYLKLLFNHLEDDTNVKKQDGMTQRRNYSHDMEKLKATRKSLQSLLPCKSEIDFIADYASGWMSLYHALFTLNFTLRTGAQLVANYDQMRSPDVHPVTLAMYLLCLVITLQQVPRENLGGRFQGYGPRSDILENVSKKVRDLVVYQTKLAGTVEGLETSLLLARLALGRNDLRETWLTFRRIIAIAEIMGLPYAFHEMARLEQSGCKDTARLTGLQQKIYIWEAICASDRHFGMMLNLGVSTASRVFPVYDFVYRPNAFPTQQFHYQIAKVAGMIVQIDDAYTFQPSDERNYEKVLIADSSLRTLAASVPSAWWTIYDPDASTTLVELMIKFWHRYSTLRAHLRPTMMFDGRFPYSHSNCRDACVDALQRFWRFRLLIPIGFFTCRVMDIQAFTAIAVLLATKPAQESEQTRVEAQLIQKILDCFEAVSTRVGSEFAREAISAVTSLQSLMNQRDKSQQVSMSLQIPLLGKIHIKGNAQESVPVPKPSSNTTVAENVSNLNWSWPTSVVDPGGFLSGAFSDQGMLQWAFEYDNAFLHSHDLFADVPGPNQWTNQMNFGQVS